MESNNAEFYDNIDKFVIGVALQNGIVSSVDFDNMKGLNDQHGEPMTDLIFADLRKYLQSYNVGDKQVHMVRNNGLTNGDEFTFFVEGEEDEAVSFLTKLQQDIHAKKFKGVNLTYTACYSTARGDGNKSLSTLIDQLERGRKYLKQQGRRGTTEEYTLEMVPTSNSRGPGQETKLYTNGDEYNGKLERGVPNGKGTMDYKTGQTYEGEWFNGKRHGQGIMQYPHGYGKYEGGWFNDQEHGQGNKIYPNGNTYEGGWRKGKCHGRGVYDQTADGEMYDGEWENGNRHGQGIQIDKNGYKYEGGWKNDCRDGQGVQEGIEGVYEGEHKYSAGQTGQGKMTYANGELYIGQWLCGQYSGYGKFTSPNGEKYEGQYVGDKRWGQGIFTYKDGETYDGEWENDQRHGLGTQYFVNGEKYQCQWKMGKAILN